MCLPISVTAPCSSPPLPTGAYRALECADVTMPDCYILQLFWQEYNDTCRNGVIHHYVITYWSAMHEYSIKATGDDGQMLFSWEITLNASTAYDICLTAHSAEDAHSNVTVTFPSDPSCFHVQARNACKLMAYTFSYGMCIVCFC